MTELLNGSAPRSLAISSLAPRDVTPATPSTSREKPPGTTSIPPLHWPSLGPFAAESAWAELLSWVDELRTRYRGLDSYVVPGCWYQHEALVMTLQSLKDHERVAYGPDAPGTAATDWHRALRDLTAMLRQFSADLRCGHGPEDAVNEQVEQFVERDIARRRRRAATVALGQ
jgi:hypothetical protein